MTGNFNNHSLGFRFSLRSLPVIVVIASFGFYVIGTIVVPKLRNNAKYNRAVSELSTKGVSFHYDWFDETGTLMCSRLIADQFSQIQNELDTLAPYIHVVLLDNSVLSVQDLNVLAKLFEAYEIDFQQSTIPADFANIAAEMPKLARLDLTNSNRQGGSLLSLRQCRELTNLSLAAAAIDDRSLSEVAEISQLHQLRIDITGLNRDEILHLATRVLEKLPVSVIDFHGGLTGGEVADDCKAMLDRLGINGTAVFDGFNARIVRNDKASRKK
jgi:hypothetical protein